MSYPGLSECLLPSELLIEIFNTLSNSRDRGTLFSLLLLHPTFQDPIERMLYRNMTDWVDTDAYQDFLITVASNPRLASYIHQYGIIEEDTGGTVAIIYMKEDTGFREAFWERVIAALGLMVNLKAFILRIADFDDDAFPVNRLISTLHGKQLEVFKWSTYNDDLTAPLFSFLGMQKDLLELSVSLFSNQLPTDMPGTHNSPSFPRLRRLAGNLGTIKLVMPYSPSITNLVWMRDSGEDRELIASDISQLADLARDITCFSITDAQFRPVPDLLLKALQSSCRTLRCLQIPHIECSVEKLIQTPFPTLEYLVFTGVSGPGALNKHNLSSLFASISSLRAIYTGTLLLHTPPEGMFEAYTHGSKSALDGVCDYCLWRRRDGRDAGSVKAVMEEIVSFDHSMMFDDLSHAYVDGQMHASVMSGVAAKLGVYLIRLLAYVV